jgi:Zn-dependent M28 family amino/carboxypeptidase
MRNLVLVLAILSSSLPPAQTAPPAIRVDAQAIFHDVEVLSADDMEGRLAGSPGGAKARAYVARRFKEAGVQPLGDGDSYDRPFSFTSRTSGERTGVNVIGVVRGTRAPDTFIVVSAHYDHIGVRDGQVFNGADDNASGVAGLLALAAHFNEVTPSHSLLICAFDAEESGVHGARAFMRDPPVPAGAIALDVNIDMIGRDASNTLFATGTYHYPFLKPYLEHVAQPPVTLAFGHDTPGQKEDWTRDSDHQVFHDAGIPFVYFGVEDFAQHHRATDDSATIMKDFLAGATATVIAAVHELDANLEAIAAKTARKGF